MPLREVAMPTHPPDPEISLPKGWPRRVRSAVIHAVSLVRVSLTFTHSWAADCLNARIRLKTDNDRLRQELALLREESRIKDARMERIPAQRRPHYPPTERLAILELRAARGWSLAQTAERFLVTPATIASWMTRLDEEGPHALVQIRDPVNRFRDLVAYLVRRLKVLCPSMGKARIARVLCRAGLHLGSTTVRRMLEEKPKKESVPFAVATGRVVTAKRPNHVWHVDLTTVPTSLGFWISWLPWALPQRWPFCWWLAVALDHFSRRVMGVAVFERRPSSASIRSFLDGTFREAGATPKYIINDHGVQFTARAFRRWCRRRGIRQRFGAIGKYGSLAVIERFIRTMKGEGTRRILVSYDGAGLERELSLFAAWYNADRPHETLQTRTPDEIYFGLRPACLAPRFEPRRRWPRGSPCAAPQARVRGRRGARLKLAVSYRAGRRHLPIVELHRAA